MWTYSKRTQQKDQHSILLALGLAFGLFKEYLEKIGNSAYIYSKMHPYYIVFIFIPVLLFESAFNCDWYTLKYQIINILHLGDPGCGWDAILLGACFKIILQYGDDDMNWYEAFTLGSVLLTQLLQLVILKTSYIAQTKGLFTAAANSTCLSLMNNLKCSSQNE